ncbi:hypothetical protein TWF132_001326 [Orbilia oligospora]|nr:hypothetical protein TWF751_002059 [Orbilia oligospora]KAF3277860.1 hypothetical protein TWF132_001326 [Orbilia oligospora]
MCMHMLKLQRVARMRLSRHFLPVASRPVYHRPQEPLSYLQSSLARCIKPPRAHHYTGVPQPDLDENFQDIYDEEHVEFYRRDLAQKPEYSPFDQSALDAQYPSTKDPEPDTHYPDISCRDFTLPRNATGSILLRVYNSLNATSRSPVIMYFPSRGTNPIPTTNEHRVISELTKLTNSTTISVGYRVSPPFPLSLHDALAALDWARFNVPTVSLETYCQNNYDGRLMAVLGTGIGGSIAASIGATEGRESGIIATGAWLPIVDWAFDPLPGIPESNLSTIPRSPSLIEKYSQSELEEIDSDIISTYSQLADNPFLSSETLKSIRSRYLATPEDFTDPFVSPLYRFSSSGVNIWTDLISRVHSELLADPENPPTWVKTLPDTIFKRGPRRPVAYPPLDLVGKLTVPMMRIVSAEGDILHRQITEYVHAARISLFPSKIKTIEEKAREEAQELGKTHNNDIIKYEGIGWNFARDEARDEENEDINGKKGAQDDIEELESADTGLCMHEGKAAIVEDVKEEQDSRDNTAETNVVNVDELGYSKAGEIYVQHEIIPKAGHCLITAAGKIGSGMEEVKKMAAWINLVFGTEPSRAEHWKSVLQQERTKKALEAINTRLKRVSKL